MPLLRFNKRAMKTYKPISEGMNKPPRIKSRLRVLWVFLLLSITLLTGATRLNNASYGEWERIKNFDSQIAVSRDGSIIVTETIQVVAAGDEVQRGIYRDFPTLYRDREGNRVRVEFRLLSVERGGQPEPYHVERRLNGLRVYIGRNDSKLIPGEHTYVLTYKVDRVVSFYKAQDELFWNVTGQVWSLPIERVSATIILPVEFMAEDVYTEAYTGTSNNRGQDFAVARKDATTTRFVATRALNPGEEMTITLSWPKGVVQRPDFWQRLEYLFRDSRGSISALFGLLLITAWYLVAWILVGRDPHKGLIKPVFVPPGPVSPGAMRFLMKMGFDFRTFVAVVLSLACKGHLLIKEQNKVLSLLKQESSTCLTGEESLVKDSLPPGELVLDKANAKAMAKVVDACRQELTKTYKGHYFATNRRWLMPGFILSGIFAIAGLVLAVLDGQLLVLPAALGLVIWSSLLYGSVGLGMEAWRQGKRTKALLMAGGGLVLIVGWLTVLGFLASSGEAGLIFVLTLLIQLNLLFSYLMKAPTPRGRRLMDRIEGFRLYMVMTKEDYHGLTPPEQTPAVFATNLAYAYALDVDRIWSEHFAKTLDEIASAPCPPWYLGDDFHGKPVEFADHMATSLAGSLFTAAHPPAPVKLKSCSIFSSLKKGM